VTLHIKQDQGAILSTQNRVAAIDPLEIRVAKTRLTFQDVLLKVWLFQMPNTHSIFLLIRRYRSDHLIVVDVPLCLLDGVLSLDFIQRLHSIILTFQIPHLDGVILPTAQQNIALIRVPIKTQCALDMRFKCLCRLELLPHVPNIDFTVFMAGSDIIGVHRVVLHALDALLHIAAIYVVFANFHNTLFRLINIIYQNSLIKTARHKLLGHLWIPIKSALISMIVITLQILLSFQIQYLNRGIGSTEHTPII
jgi:hypothetical protein